jgi:DMSO/TMAO reductase YedYZ molybdopterin-dependent catalytic subunit
MLMLNGKTNWRRLLFLAIFGIILGTGTIFGFEAYRNYMSKKVGINLGFVEVREYEGKDLFSVKDFRENSIKGPQYININDYKLKIAGLVDRPGDFTYEELINNHQSYKKAVELNCVEGWSVNILWEGILVKDLLKEAGVSPGAKIVIFHAFDGYTTSFPIDYLLNNDIIMAYKMNGGALLPERGFPFELVAESKWGYKWIKWITEIELSDDVNYKGYWESRGYSNEGDLNKGFIGN